MSDQPRDRDKRPEPPLREQRRLRSRHEQSTLPVPTDPDLSDGTATSVTEGTFATMDEMMNIGEIGRSLTRLENSQREQNEKLDEIRDQTMKTNGTLLVHEERLKFLESRDRRRAHHQHEMKRTSDRSDVITLNIPAGVLDAKKMAAVVAGVLAGLVAAWKAGLFR